MRTLIVLALLIPALALGADQDDTDMRLTVKPVLCITDNRNPSCDISFLVVWQSSATAYYCLFNDIAETPLRCWNEARTGQLNDDRTVTEDFSFWMTGTDTGTRLAQVDVEVLRLDSDDRRRRRRTRHVWDIN